MSLASPPAFSANTPASQAQVAAVEVQALTHEYPLRRRGKAASAHASASASAALASPGEGQRPALSEVSFTIPAGQIFGVLGPNGGGKSTLFRILSTLMRPTRGSIRILGHDVLQSPAAARSVIGVVFQHPSVDVRLTALENLLHHGQLYGLHGPSLRSRSLELLNQFGLADRAHDPVLQFSGGMRRKVEIAKAILPQPRILILDEPTTGLDVAARAELMRHMHQLRSTGQTIVLTTHLMDEAEQCDSLIVLSRGRLVAQGSPASLRARIGGDVIVAHAAAESSPAELSQLAQAITDRFGPWSQQDQPRIVESSIRLQRQDGATFLATLANAFPNRFSQLSVGKPTLQDVFLQLTGEEWE